MAVAETTDWEVAVGGTIALGLGNLERVEGLTGIEPALSAWEAEVLPLNYSPMSPVRQHWPS